MKRTSDGATTEPKLARTTAECLRSLELGEAFKIHPVITTLDLKLQKIDSEGLKLLAQALDGNKTLTSLNLSHCLEMRSLFGSMLNKDHGCPTGEALKSLMCLENCALKTLDISHLYLKEEGASLIAQALEVNTSITSLKLSGNNFGREGSCQIVFSLPSNASLVKFDLSENEIDDEASCHLGEYLKSNSTLKDLKLKLNRIKQTGVIAIFTGLTQNVTLTSLDLTYNDFKSNDPNLLNLIEKNLSLTSINFDYGQPKRIEQIMLRNKKNPIPAHQQSPHPKLQEQPQKPNQQTQQPKQHFQTSQMETLQLKNDLLASQLKSQQLTQDLQKSQLEVQQLKQALLESQQKAQQLSQDLQQTQKQLQQAQHQQNQPFQQQPQSLLTRQKEPPTMFDQPGRRFLEFIPKASANFKAVQECLLECAKLKKVDSLILTNMESKYNDYKNQYGEPIALAFSTCWLYTTESWVYTHVNETLRNDFPSLEKIAPYIKCVIQSHKQFGGLLYSGTVYRRTKLSNANFLKYQVGKHFVWPSFTSTATQNPPSNFGPVLFKIVIPEDFNFVALNLQPISEFPNEEEILLLPNTAFKVTQIVSSPNVEIHLEITHYCVAFK